LNPSTKLLGERLVPGEKVSEYLLNVEHPDGGGKAKFFIAHGFEAGTPGTLASAIHAHADLNDISETHAGPHGTKTIVRCSIPTPDGRNPCILVVWIREKGCAEQRLVTAYPYDDRPRVETSA
jgi:filamentous hemagglutinin